MNPNLIKMIATAYEVCGSTELSQGAQAVIVSSLSAHPEAAVWKALERCCKEVKGRLSLAHIEERIDDGRPGADEAWAIAERARDEANTVVWTGEMCEAFGLVRLMDDTVAARMAFKESYTRICADARSRGRAVRWHVSQGAMTGRMGPILEAAQLGRLSASYARRLCPDLPQLPGEERLLPDGDSAEVDQLVASTVAAMGGTDG